MRLLASVAAVAMIASACSSGSEDPSGDETTAEDQPTDAATGDDQAATAADCGTRDLVWVHEQEPPNMHLDDPNNNLSATSWVRQALWEGLYGHTEDVQHFPELLAEELEVTDNGDGTFTITGTLRGGLTWSDGTPLTAEHVVGTHNIIMEGVDPETGEGGVYLIGSRAGYDQVTSIEATSATEFVIEMDGFYSGYKTLYSEIFPTHVVPDATTANETFPDFAADGETLPSSGPMLFDEWEKGTSIHLVTNADYHGSVSPDVERQGEIACVSGVQINYVQDTDTQINTLNAGEADVIFTQPQTQFEGALAENEDFTVSIAPGPTFEHWGLNLYDDHLQDPLVREALALVMDKTEVMAGLYTPIFGDVLPAEGLGNSYWMSNQPAYEDHAGNAGYGAGDVEGALAKLEEAGYSLNDSGLMEHPDRGELILRVGTTGGNELRELQQQLLQAKFLEAGIRIEIDNVEGGAYFSEVILSPEAMACATGTPDGETTGEGDEAVTADCDVWDITQFAWVGGPWPGGQSANYRCGGGTNMYGYCNENFDERSAECDQTVDEAELAACFNELDTYATTLGPDGDGLFVLPLTQKPDFYAWSNIRLAAAPVAPDTQFGGPLVNVVDYVPAETG